MKMDSHHFLHAVLDHLRGEEVSLSFLVHGDFPVVLQQDGADGLGRVGHVDGPVVANHLAEIRQGPAMVQVEVTGKEQVMMSFLTPVNKPVFYLRSFTRQ